MTESTLISKQDNLISALETAWTRWPERIALKHGAVEVTYGELGSAILRLADVYHSIGIRRLDRIACSVSNRPEQIIALGAAWACGALHVGLDYQFTPAEISSVIELTKASTLVLQPGDSFSDLQTLRRQYPELRIFVVGDRLASEATAFSALVDFGGPPDQSGSGSRESPSAPDPAIIFISSGTTGRPKATVGFHGNLAQRWQRLSGWLRFGPTDVHLAQLPLSHGFGLMMAMAALLTGGKLILLDRFSAEDVLHTVTTQGVTVLNGAPAHFKLILNRLEPTRHRTQSLRLSVGTAAFFSPELISSIWERLGVEFMFMYGSSEGVGVATTDREDMLRGSVGKPTAGSVIIVGPDRQPLPPGETGEIAFSRQVFPVRYWEDASASSASSVAPQAAEGKAPWYYSGDLGRLDEDGRLYVFGRMKHQIDRGGLKVDPVEVETALLRCRGVADAAVLGQANPILGETVCACVVAAPDSIPTLEQLRSALQDQLAPYKLPEELYVLDHIPRTQLGKVDLKKLKENIAPLPGQHMRQR
jgi:acyl-CoA synthetase (AMP-forming)/AMP-acid ligase II